VTYVNHKHKEGSQDLALSDEEGTNARVNRVDVLTKKVMGAKRETKNALRM
jgi:hypothetical protein